MLAENLRNLRKEKGLSQEEVAARLHVVRQTISKWEKGLSVPDADVLSRLAELYEVPVSKLLGENVAPPPESSDVAQRLEQLNLLLAERNRRSRLIWRVIAGIFIGSIALVLVVLLLGMIFSFTGHQGYQRTSAVAVRTELNTSSVLTENAP